MWRFALLSAVVAPSAFAGPVETEEPRFALDVAGHLGLTGVLCTESSYGCGAGAFDVAPAIGVDLGVGALIQPGRHLMLRVHGLDRAVLGSPPLLAGSFDIGVRFRLDASSAFHVGFGPQVQLFYPHNETTEEQVTIGAGLFLRYERTISTHMAIGVETIPNLWQQHFSDIRVLDVRVVAALRR